MLPGVAGTSKAMTWRPNTRFVVMICVIATFSQVVFYAIQRSLITLSDLPGRHPRHWLVTAVLLGVGYGACALCGFIVFRKRLSKGTVLLLTLNVVTAWGMMVLYFITLEPQIEVSLEQFGLGALKWVFLFGALMWFAALCYSFAQAVDSPVSR